METGVCKHEKRHNIETMFADTSILCLTVHLLKLNFQYSEELQRKHLISAALCPKSRWQHHFIVPIREWRLLTSHHVEVFTFRKQQCSQYCLIYFNSFLRDVTCMMSSYLTKLHWQITKYLTFSCNSSCFKCHIVYM